MSSTDNRHPTTKVDPMPESLGAAKLASDSNRPTEMTADRCLPNLRDVADVLGRLRAASVFLVADANAYPNSGAEAILTPLLAESKVTLFSQFEPNPKLADVQSGLAMFRDSGAQLLIAIGGGTAIDIAKLIAVCANESADPLAVIQKQHVLSATPPALIAIPTTAGTGSEATQFAVVYVDGVKHSVDHPRLLPDYCVLDPKLTANLPPLITAQTGLDAFSQSVESLWSVRSTIGSVDDATEAANLAWSHLHEAVHSPTPTARAALCRAAHLSGRAVNVTRTTACHAISYALTSDYGIPHGHAVAITLGAVLEYNAAVSDEDCCDPRGPAHVRATIDRILALLGCHSASEARQAIEQFVQSLGCEIRLSRLGIRGTQSLRSIAEQINVERLMNNPRRLSGDRLVKLLHSVG